jgi:hypothetical protein
MNVQNDERVSTADLLRDQAEQRQRGAVSPNQEDNRPVALFNKDDADDLRQRWYDVQARFVDDPRGSVGAADELVATTIRRLTEIFADERNRLETEWGNSDQVGTEELRVAFRRYRSFFDRLLSI